MPSTKTVSLSRWSGPKIGTFTPYSTGVKANVLFFRKGQPTREVWIYDQRTNIPNVTKSQPLTEAHFAGFRASYGPHHTPHPGQRQESERLRCFSRQAIAGRDDNLDLFWLRDASLDDPNELPELEDLVGEALTRLETAMDALNELAAVLEMNEGGMRNYED